MGYESNLAEDIGDKSVKLTPDDQDNIDKAGYALDTSVSTLLTELAEDAKLLAQLKEDKKQEVRELREKARDIENRWDLE